MDAEFSVLNMIREWLLIDREFIYFAIEKSSNLVHQARGQIGTLR